jgi:hypothetical protein
MIAKSFALLALFALAPAAHAAETTTCGKVQKVTVGKSFSSYSSDVRGTIVINGTTFIPGPEAAQLAAAAKLAGRAICVRKVTEIRSGNDQGYASQIVSIEVTLEE